MKSDRSIQISRLNGIRRVPSVPTSCGNSGASIHSTSASG